MKTMLAIEEAAQCVIAILALYFQPLELPGWAWGLLFFAPDIAMLGYLAGPRTGARTYNLAHHKGIALSILALGWLLTAPVVVVAGLLLFAHSSFDRMLGYGLKYPRGFGFTHLGRIGNATGQA